MSSPTIMPAQSVARGAWLACRRACALLAAAVLTCVALDAPRSVLAQMTAPKSYTDFYREKQKQTHVGYMSPRQYTYNKHFYHNPAISPYSNLMRPASPYVPKYQTYVQPELQRRAAPPQTYAPSPSPLQPRVPTGTQYHNKYYANQGQLPR